MGIKNKTYDTRYFTYYLTFPGEENDPWIDQVPFIHELQFELRNTTFGKVPDLARSILLTGECEWKDHNGVKHRVVVEEEARPKNWGKRGSLRMH
jgi:hypothetical protein